jgi:4-hydroxythreonine-4-phosphate dehydrogenase
MENLIVTHGHEQSIGLEVFIKSLSHFSKKQIESITFFTEKELLKKGLKDLKIHYRIEDDFCRIGQTALKCNFHEPSLNIPQTTSSILNALESLAKFPGTLFTLPSSKDQFLLNGKQLNGHTDFFRAYYQLENITMCFSSNTANILLLTDHCRISDVAKKINTNLVFQKTELFIKKFPKVKKVIFAGINPHAGENGLMGDEEKHIIIAMKKLALKYASVDFSGPFSGDIVFTKADNQSVVVYSAHDQGLAPFKLSCGLYGANISLGLPFMRFSPDHGTAFDLYAKNKANYYGTLYALKTALAYEKYRNQKCSLK